MKGRAEPMTTNELTCKELVELVTDYVEDALPDDERMRFEDHLAGCTGCRRYLEQMRTTIRTVGQLREDDLSPMARADLLAVFRNWKQTRNGA
jgi:anti-sigma factor RsiW